MKRVTLDNAVTVLMKLANASIVRRHDTRPRLKASFTTTHGDVEGLSDDPHEAALVALNTAGITEWEEPDDAR